MNDNTTELAYELRCLCNVVAEKKTNVHRISLLISCGRKAADEIERLREALVDARAEILAIAAGFNQGEILPVGTDAVLRKIDVALKGTDQ